MSDNTIDVRQAIARIEQPQEMALDAQGRKAAIDDLLNKVALVMEVQSRVMKPGEHFGTIPGCGDKPALFKAGAEKLGMTFRLKPSFQVDERDLGRGHREYRVNCVLSDGTMGVGVCSTMESKYRYRGGERKCPECGKPTIRQQKKDDKHPEPGFYCWAKLGGCGVNFRGDDKRITSQSIEKVEHDNPADFYNTCLKMGKKRAHVDAIITATACSDIFAQDVEDIVDKADAFSADAPSAAQAAPKQSASPPPSTSTPKPAQRSIGPTEAHRERVIELLSAEDLLNEGREFFEKVGGLLPTEVLEDLPLHFVPATKEQMAALLTAIGAFAHGDEARLPYPKQEVSEPAAKPKARTTAPAPEPTGDDASSEPWYPIVVPIPRKGTRRDEYLKNPDTIGSLYEARHGTDDMAQEARQRLWGFVNHFEPKGWTKQDGTAMPPSAADYKFREALDQFVDWFEKTHPDERL